MLSKTRPTLFANNAFIAMKTTKTHRYGRHGPDAWRKRFLHAYARYTTAEVISVPRPVFRIWITAIQKERIFLVIEQNDQKFPITVEPTPALVQEVETTRLSRIQQWATIDATQHGMHDKQKGVPVTDDELERIAHQTGYDHLKALRTEIQNPQFELDDYKEVYRNVYKQIIGQDLPTREAKKIVLIAHKDYEGERATPLQGDLLRARAILRARDQYHVLADLSEQTLREIARLADIYRKHYERAEDEATNKSTKEED
jgi:hypothetical protein